MDQDHNDTPAASGEDIARKKALIAALENEVEQFYKRLFSLNVGGEFHPFLEWCGVMGEHLRIVDGLLAKGVDATQANVHTGQTLPIPEHQIDYMAEKIECIFSGMLEVKRIGVKENGSRSDRQDGS